MKEITTRLLVIGGGPGGYVAAIRAGQLGVSTVLVETSELGGTCLTIGCIPSKAMIHAARQFEHAAQSAGGSPLGIRAGQPSIDITQTVQWKDGIVSRLTGGVGTLLRKAGVKVIKGWAQVQDGKTVTVQAKDGESMRVQCEHLLLATGSEPVELPMAPFGGAVVSSTELLSPVDLPRHLVVVGAGYIGLELGIAYRKLGADVTVVEAENTILPRYDAELTKPVLQSLKRHGITLHLDCSMEGHDERTGVHIRNAQADQIAIDADRVLVAVGRRPRSSGNGIESLQLRMDGHFIAVDDRCQTSMRSVWAIGDVTGEPMLAHRAMAQGVVVAEQIAGQNRRFQPLSIPAVCFTDPEIVTAGLSAAQAEDAGVDCIQGTFPFAANGRAMTLQSTAGFVRVIARRDNHLILGWQAVGQDVSELAAAFSQSMEMGAQLEDIAGTIHAHPTLGEAVQEAALQALGQALHI
ncbi:MAG: dihydrolipoyl dehydrogenase [Ottowia sp.]|nr:dihydrolipoyl dehydrogenase [Ottowia sp.]